MGACPHLRGRGRSSHEEAAAVRDGRGSPSHQHTVTGRQLYFLLLSAGGRAAVTSKLFRGRGGGCRHPAYTKLESGRAWNKIPAFVCLKMRSVCSVLMISTLRILCVGIDDLNALMRTYYDEDLTLTMNLFRSMFCLAL